MSGSVRVFAEYDRDLAWSCDVAIVGSGPGGAVVAYELASRGRDVVLIEEGPPFTPSDYVPDASISMARTMREGGLPRASSAPSRSTRRTRSPKE